MEGSCVFRIEGRQDGCRVGNDVTRLDGLREGCFVLILVGVEVGLRLSVFDGALVGRLLIYVVGDTVIRFDGRTEGFLDTLKDDGAGVRSFPMV